MAQTEEELGNTRNGISILGRAIEEKSKLEVMKWLRQFFSHEGWNYSTTTT